LPSEAEKTARSKQIFLL